jgi:NADH dehydrogenase
LECEKGDVMGDGRTRVLIIGGGFGGLFCARRLGRVDVEVTLLDRAACHVFQPLLYQCATGTLSTGQISHSLRAELARHRNPARRRSTSTLTRARSPPPRQSTFTLTRRAVVAAVCVILGHEVRSGRREDSTTR